MNRSINVIFVMIALSALVVSSACSRDKSKPGREFMADTDMYRNPKVKTYEASNLFSDGTSARLPEEGTVPRGYTTYNKPNTNEAYFASLEKKGYPDIAPKKNEANLKEGERLYIRFCNNCHGVKGDGNGNLVEQGKFAGVPTYDSQRLPDITPQSIFHVITHGKGVMGSHAAQIQSADRWRIVQYVLSLRAELDGVEVEDDQVEDEAVSEDDSEETEG
ncbi:MAG: cytochrome c [Cryomorphaceae bacterium]|nr:cytochrome c [Cryomorphaceae bacterium]